MRGGEVGVDEAGHQTNPNFQDVNKPYRSITILVYIGLYFVNLVMKSERGWAERRGGAYGRLCMSAK